MTDTNSNNNDVSQGIEPGRHHVSKSYIPLTVFRSLWVVVIALIAALMNAANAADDIFKFASSVKMLPVFIIIAAVVLLGLVAVIATISYKRLTWEITEDELHIYKGIFVKKKSHLPFRRIHSVDINAKIIDRIFGVVTVKLDTAAGSVTSEDAKIPALHLSTAEILRTEIFQRKKMAEMDTGSATEKGGGNVLDTLSTENEKIRGVFAGDPFSMAPESEYRLVNKELIIFCLANGKAFAIIFAVLFFVYQSIDVLNTVNKQLGETADHILDTALKSGVLILIAIFIVAFVISVIISFITRALTYGNFVVRRYGGRIEVSTGLLQKKSTGIAVERIQTLKIKQGLLQRILGYAEISLETASGVIKTSGNDQETNPGVIIHPFIKADKVDDFMGKMLKEFSDRPKELEGLTGLAMRRSIIRYGMWTLLLIVLPLNICWYAVRSYGLDGNVDPGMISLIQNLVYGCSAGFFILMLLLGWGVWKGRAYARNARYMAMRKGIIGRTKIFVPKKKIQYALVAQNPFQKRADLVTIKANTAALGTSNESIKDIGISIGDDYLDWIENKKENIS